MYFWWFRISQGRIPSRSIIGWGMRNESHENSWFFVFSTLWRFTWDLTQFTCFLVPDIFHLAEPPSSNSKCFAIYLVKNHSNLTRPHPKWWLSKGNPLIAGKSRLVKHMFSWYSSLAHVFCLFWAHSLAWQTVKRGFLAWGIQILRSSTPTNTLECHMAWQRNQPDSTPRWWLTERHETKRLCRRWKKRWHEIIETASFQLSDPLMDHPKWRSLRNNYPSKGSPRKNLDA